MEQNTLRKQRELTDRLNRYRNEYYNYNNPSVSDDRNEQVCKKLKAKHGLYFAGGKEQEIGRAHV